jgi:protein TonB
VTAEERSPALRWGGGAAIALLLHGCVIVLLLRAGTLAVPVPPAAEAIMLDLQPAAPSPAGAILSAPAAEPPPMPAPSPAPAETSVPVPAQAAETPPVPSAVETAPDPSEPALPEPAVPQATVPDPVPLAPPPAFAPAIVPVPAPAPRPPIHSVPPRPATHQRPVPAARPVPPARAPETTREAPATPASPASPAPPALARAPDPVAAASWRSALVARLQAAKRYPEQAREAGEQGVALARFTIDRAGRVLSASLVRSSGFPALDEEAIALIHRAEPLPPLPADTAGSTVTLTVPVSFALR